jgi:hypothetical protein
VPRNEIAQLRSRFVLCERLARDEGEEENSHSEHQRFTLFSRRKRNAEGDFYLCPTGDIVDIIRATSLGYRFN